MPNHRNNQQAATRGSRQLTDNSRNELVYQFAPDCPIHVEIEGETLYFLANDLCKVLYTQKPESALRKLDSDEKLMRKLSASGQARKSWFVTESGLYHLIFGSTKKEAQKFRRWVTGVVLPEIRRTGGYFSTLSGLTTYEQDGQEMYRYSEVLNALAYKKGGSAYKLQERYPKDFANVDGAVLVSKTYATVMSCRRRASSILKGIKARQLELPFATKEVSHV